MANKMVKKTHCMLQLDIVNLWAFLTTLYTVWSTGLRMSLPCAGRVTYLSSCAVYKSMNAYSNMLGLTMLAG